MGGAPLRLIVDADQGILVAICPQDNVSATSAVATIGPAARYEFLAPEARGAMAAVACGGVEGYLVDERSRLQAVVTERQRLASTAARARSGGRDDAHSLSVLLELDDPVPQSKERVVAAALDVLTGQILRSTLSYDDGSGCDRLPSVALDAKTPAAAVTPVLS
jgi:hypothetical protein